MTTLYGTLISHLAADYEKQTSALNSNTPLINRFGEAVAPFELDPHVHAVDRTNVRLVATSKRGRAHAPLFQALTANGFTVGEPEKAPHQFNDGYLMWTVQITNRALSFSLLYYTEVEAC